MKNARVLKVLLIAGIVALCTGLLSACSSSNAATKGTAAIVDGTEISEQSVTDRIQKYRAEQGLDDDDSWGEYLVSESKTPEEMRTQYIDVLVGEKVLCDYAYEIEVNVDDSEVDEAVNSFKANYSSDDTWEKALKQSGFTDESYHSTIRLSLTEKKVLNYFMSQMEMTQDDYMEAVKNYLPLFDGAKRSSHILFKIDDPSDTQAVAAIEQKANGVLEQLKDGSLDFADAARMYSDDGSAESGGDVGWDATNSFVSEYTEALSHLEPNQISGLVTSDYGIHIILVTDKYTAPDVENLQDDDEVPEEFLSKIAEVAVQMKAISLTQDWLKEMKEKADITVNDMPKGLIYDVDLNKYGGITTKATSDDAESSDNSDDEAEILADELGIEELGLEGESGQPLDVTTESENSAGSESSE